MVGLREGLRGVLGGGARGVDDLERQGREARGERLVGENGRATRWTTDVSQKSTHPDATNKFVHVSFRILGGLQSKNPFSYEFGHVTSKVGSVETLVIHRVAPSIPFSSNTLYAPISGPPQGSRNQHSWVPRS